MRAYLASAIGVACTAALVLPSLAVASPATPAATVSAPAPANEALPGSTQSLPLAPLAPRGERSASPAATPQGVAERDVQPFSLVGVVWDDAATELDGTVQVRTRAAGKGTWSTWQHVETHNSEHAADPGTAERDSGKVRGSTAPLWVGASDGVEVRVQSASAEPSESPARHESAAHSERAARAPLPAGLRLELVDPGVPPPAGSPTDAERSSMATELPALTRAETEADAGLVAARPYIGPRPRIITRKGWGADETMRERKLGYTKTVKAAFVHHSATGNNYTCKQASSVLRSIYRYHVKSSGWRDLGYNFAVDKCGNIYEGRAGGVAKPVLGAHTLGFNTNSTGIAVLGSYTSSNPPAAAVDAVARITAWKLGLHGANPRAKTTLKSGGGNLYKKGRNVRLNVISGHRDGFATECPGIRLYNRLGTARSSSARLQGR
ncbi:N-acetylmuramoyl-L-alanine amidase [Streptomyces sp. H27-C3]|uniref:N-acetylmuramoyl-L-alanine amidase n=1 Tax=Streptomyces sp. H27-C3 TaxID=3046305 RepID=UPI0024B9013A|nr:N-acetylmuramoyl-L-alanine amidase [Streptomyces sp. H27-C3]MDJ0460357.1 N-acetylmuramoyl-L-alanine amidase [Streptomyces sp. H27-C3]